MTFRTTLIGAAVLAATLDSGALTLGPVRGTAVLGQPVDLTFEVRLDSAGDAACVSAEVFHADNPVDPARVRAAVVPGASGLAVAVRVVSSAAVDEPVVTVALRAGCTQSATRRYVLLAEPPADLRAGTASSRFGAALPMAVAPQTPLRGTPGAGSSGNGPAAPFSSAAAAAVAGAAPLAAPPRIRPPRAATPPASITAPVAPRTAVRLPAPEPGNRPRLRLDPADLEAERDAFLKPSFDLPTLPADDPQRRADAAALWRALNTQPQDVLRDAKRLETLEADTKSLRELALRNQAAMAQLQTRVDDTAPGRFGNPVLLVLAALLAAALAVFAWLWLRSRGLARSRHWWQDSGMGASRNSTVVRDGAPSMFPPGMTVLAPGMPLDVDLSAFGDDALPGPAAAAVGADTSAAGKVTPRIERAVHPEELFDIQQQADFFVSLGQYDQAVEVLQRHIDEAPARSPLAYLDLLKIFHTLSRSADYQRVREAFNATFNGDVPEFAGFNRAGRVLEAYPDVLEHLQSIWGQAEAAAQIEDLMFRQPDQADAAFELDAYRELLLLHAVAKGLAPRVRTGGGFNDAGGPLFSDSRPAPMLTLPVSAGHVRQQRPETGALGAEPPLEWPSGFSPLEPRTEDRAPGTTPMALAGGAAVDLDLGSEAPPAPGPGRSSGRARREATVLDVPAHPVLARMLPDDPTMPSEVSPAEAVDSHLIDFDLFDTGSDPKRNPPKP